MKVPVWLALGFASFFSTCTLVAGAAEINHAAISKRVIRDTERVFGPGAASRIAAWSELVTNNKDKPISEKLALTNSFFNRVPVKSEEEIWGHMHWSTPFEMLLHNAGSQADHTIAKYITLEAMGISIDHMTITHVHSMKSSNLSYMVLTYHEKRGVVPLVLDTMNDEIKPADQRTDLFPEDSLNDSGLWLSNKQKDERNDAQEEAAVHVELWNDMNARLDKEHLSTEDPGQMW